MSKKNTKETKVIEVKAVEKSKYEPILNQLALWF